MRKQTFKVLAFTGLMGMATAAVFTSCSDNNDATEQTGDSRKWGTNGGLKSADNLLFDGNQIGNGDKEFVFTGKQTLKKGVYTLKGWVYIADGAELTIEPGTIIKGDKQTKAALIAERGGKLIAQGTATDPIVFTSAVFAEHVKHAALRVLFVRFDYKTLRCPRVSRTARRARTLFECGDDFSGYFHLCFRLFVI